MFRAGEASFLRRVLASSFFTLWAFVEPLQLLVVGLHFLLDNSGGLGRPGRGEAEAVAVAIEQNVLGVALGALEGLDPLAPAGRGPHGLEEAEGPAGGVGAVVAAHDGLDGVAGLFGVVEGDGADVVVQDVGLNNVVEEVAADETEVAVDGGGGAAGEGPCVVAGVVGEGRVGVLEVGDGD